jgi:hypothetical protein
MGAGCNHGFSLSTMVCAYCGALCHQAANTMGYAHGVSSPSHLASSSLTVVVGGAVVVVVVVAIIIIVIIIVPISQAVAHSGGWGGDHCCCSHLHCSSFPCHEQLLTVVVGGAVVVRGEG